MNEYPLILGWAKVSLYEAGATDLNTQFAWKDAKAEEITMSEQNTLYRRYPTGSVRPKLRTVPNGYAIQWKKLLLLPVTTFQDVVLTSHQRWVLDVVWQVDDEGHDLHGRWFRRTFTGVMVEASQVSSQQVFELVRGLNFQAEACVSTGGIVGDPPALTTPLAT